MDESTNSRKQIGDASSQLPPSVMKVSKRKIVYVEIDDEITTVYDRVKNLPIDEVYVVVPERATLFESAVNLKILQHTLAGVGKRLAIITHDSVGKKLAEQAGIELYDKMGQTAERLVITDPDSPRLKISPLQAVKNVFEDDTPKKLGQRKIAINDLVKTRKGRQSPLLVVERLAKRMKKPHRLVSWWRNRHFPTVTSNRVALSGLIGISFLVLLLISYIALPGVTLYISPSSNVIEKSVNIVLLEKNKNEAELSSRPRNTIAVYPLNPSATRITLTYTATGTIFKGENARGDLTIINKRRSPWLLVTKTRFQTSDGLVFRIAKAVTVPPATASNEGTLTVPVTADEYDIYSKVVGERGNIGPTKFWLPGLNQANQKILWAESKGSMSGGRTNVTKVVTKEDVGAAVSKAKQDVLSAIVPALEKMVTEMNAKENNDYTVLTEEQLSWQRAIKYGEPRILVASDLVGKAKDVFTVTAEIDVRGVTYKKSELLAILKNELHLRKSPEKTLVSIDENSLSYRLFEADSAAGRYKMTATIKGIEEYELEPSQENGARLISKIKEHILGKDIKEAHDYIQNLPEIHTVEIKSWPIWAPTIPTVIDNIEVKVVEE